MSADLVALPDLYEVPEGEEARKAWRVDGLGTATWAMEHALDIAHQQREIEQVADQRMERIRSWRDDQIRKLQADRDFFEGALRLYALELRAADPKRKSVVTPFGAVSTVAGRETWRVADEAAAIAALRENRPELVVRKESLAIGEAKKVLEADGDGRVVDTMTGLVVPGISVDVAPVSARVKLDGFA